MIRRALSCFLLFSAVAGADTLLLRTGARIAGRWWGTDADTVHFLVEGRLQHYARREVSEIVFGEGPVAVTGAAPEAAPAVRPNSSPTVVMPEQIGVVYFQDSGGNLLALEQIVAAGHRTAAGFNTRRPGQYWDMPGARSSFRLHAGAALRFAVELPGGISPATMKLYPLESKGSVRRTKVAGATPADIPVSVRRIAGNVYEYSVVGGLSPGEYAFSPANSNDTFCFGIDPPLSR